MNLLTPLCKSERVPFLEDCGLLNQLNRLFGYLSLFAAGFVHVVDELVPVGFVSSVY